MLLCVVLCFDCVVLSEVVMCCRLFPVVLLCCVVLSEVAWMRVALLGIVLR